MTLCAYFIKEQSPICLPLGRFSEPQVRLSNDIFCDIVSGTAIASCNGVGLVATETRGPFVSAISGGGYFYSSLSLFESNGIVTKLKVFMEIKMKRSQLCTLAAFAVMLCFGTSALAHKPKGTPATIDFEELSSGYVDCPTCDPTADQLGLGPSYSSEGYIFSYTPAPGEPYPTGLQEVGPFYPYNRGGTNAILANSSNALVTLKYYDGRPFSLTAIDLAEANGALSIPTKVMFHGRTVSGDIVSKQFTLDNITGFQRFVFPKKFEDLLYVEWRQGDNSINGIHLFDNVQLIATKFMSPF